MIKFKDRIDAGKQLVVKLSKYRGRKDAIILALPRGGVIVGAEIARKLKLPLDLIITRKIGHPVNPEYAIAACGKHALILSTDELEIDKKYLTEEVKIQRKEIERRLKIYRKGKPSLKIKNKTIILADDGIATGLTMMAAIKEINLQKPKKIILIVPVAPGDTIKKIRPTVNEMIVLEIPDDFYAVGQFYQLFPQVSDQEVINLLNG